MKKLKKTGISLLIISILVSFINITPIAIADTYENYVADKTVTALRPGDEVYFDNSVTNWEHVYIYIWQDNTTNYKPWGEADELTRIGETNIYKFTVPNEDTFNTHKFKNIIFKNGISGRSNQTINLGFIESGFAYYPNQQYTGDYINGDYAKDKRLGYWYLYDKNSIVEHLNSLKQYQDNKAIYTAESYGNLDDLITQAANDLQGEIILYAYQENGHDINRYYIQIATTLLNTIDARIAGLEVFKGKIDIRNRWKWYCYNKSNR